MTDQTPQSTAILSCTCISVYQDRQYGERKRLHNHAPKNKGYRCTVCGRINGAYN